MASELSVLRGEIGLSQEQLCDILGVTRAHLSRIENHKQKLQWNMFLSILLFFYQNDKTRKAVEEAELLPDNLRDVLRVDLTKE